MDGDNSKIQPSDLENHIQSIKEQLQLEYEQKLRESRELMALEIQKFQNEKEMKQMKRDDLIKQHQTLRSELEYKMIGINREVQKVNDVVKHINNIYMDYKNNLGTDESKAFFSVKLLIFFNAFIFY